MIIAHRLALRYYSTPQKHSAQRKTALWLIYGKNYSLNLCFANKYPYLYYSIQPTVFQDKTTDIKRWHLNQVSATFFLEII